MEKCGADTAVISSSFKWSDIGSWEALDELWDADEVGNRSTTGKLVSISSEDNTIVTDKLVALLGVDNLIIVETEDALLICKKERAQEIKSLVDAIEKKGLTDHL